MKLYRYMSLTELAKIELAIEENKTMKSDKDHNAYRTSSNGFCFLPETTKYSERPDEAYEWLAGIVEESGVLVEFEVLNESNLTKGYGTYAVPLSKCGWDSDFWGTFKMDEYSTKEYSPIKDLKPTRFKKYKEHEWGEELLERDWQGMSSV